MKQQEEEFRETLRLLRGAGWIAHADEYEAAVNTIATIRGKLDRLEYYLVEYGIVDFLAVDEPEGYDRGDMMTSINELKAFLKTSDR